MKRKPNEWIPPGDPKAEPTTQASPTAPESGDRAEHTTRVTKGHKPPHPRGVKPKGALSTSELKQQEVVGLRAQNISKAAIAKATGLDRKTVTRILSQGEYQLIVQRGRSELAALIPRAIGVLAYFLKKKVKTDKCADVAISILTGLQVFVPKSRTDIAAAQPNKYEGWTKEQILEYIQTGKKPNEEEF